MCFKDSGVLSVGIAGSVIVFLVYGALLETTVRNRYVYGLKEVMKVERQKVSPLCCAPVAEGPP